MLIRLGTIGNVAIDILFIRNPLDMLPTNRYELIEPFMVLLG